MTNIDTNTVPIHCYDFNEIREKSFVHIIGKRGTGKSNMIKTLIKRFNDIERKVVISPQEKYNRFYSDYSINTNTNIDIYEDYSSEIIATLLAEQKKDPSRRIILALDDCICNKAITQQYIMQELLTNYSIYNITLMLATQTANINMYYSDYVTHIIMLKNHNIHERKKLYDRYATFFSTFDLFNLIFSEVTKNYDALLINNFGNEFNDKVFWCNSEKNTGTKNVINLIQENDNTTDDNDVGNVVVNNDNDVVNDSWLGAIKNYLCCSWLF